MNSDSVRFVRFQFWLDDHGKRVLWQELSDGEIEPAPLMMDDRLVDIQQWDPMVGIVLNHTVDGGWQRGSVPYGINVSEPVPEILPITHRSRLLEACLQQRGKPLPRI